MSEVVGSIWWLLVALGVLITFHEYGHYWVARRLGVKVLRFSVGFGRPLWRRVGSSGTEFVVAALPLGGYVKMLDEHEGNVPESEKHRAFNRQSVWSRIAITAAGPIANFIFAVLAFWVMFMVGTMEPRPIIGEASGLAEAAGLEPGDRIVAIDDRPVETWTHALLGLIEPALDRQAVQVTVEDETGSTVQRTLPLDELGDDFDEANTLTEIGIAPWRFDPPAVVGTVSEGGPAEAADIRPGDRIVAADGAAIDRWAELGDVVQEAGEAGRAVTLELQRDGRTMTTTVTPERATEGPAEGRWLLGISTPNDLSVYGDAERAAVERARVLFRYGPVDALGAAFGETWRLTASTLGLLGRMITGSASVRNLSGPISIAQLANDSASAGLTNFLFFLGLISLSLAILNLLPIPMLDGGHLLYYFIEVLKGSPVSERVQVMGQYVGLIALAALMSLAFFNDVLRLIG